ncbi:MAG: hypothetical protein IJT80_05560 [Lachnospiraceae bacterium]|nr:hypothetical protein [Lachnospiraceae bacterium]
MEEYVTKAVHDEFVKRMEDENKRQNARLLSLETAVKEISQLTVSVEKIAISLENMVNEQKAQGERLTKIEQRPVDRWDTLVKCLITGIVTIILGFALGKVFL